jgi:hypothetical protein
MYKLAQQYPKKYLKNEERIIESVTGIAEQSPLGQIIEQLQSFMDEHIYPNLTL